MAKPPVETAEWRDALLSLVEAQGAERARFVLDELAVIARGPRIGWSPELVTPYVNTIAVEQQPAFPGDLAIEERLASLMRWNALAMVARANAAYGELGGHIASYASAADLFEVVFNHFFRARNEAHGGDLVFFQPHSAPGVYARAFLEGRLGIEQLDNYRREARLAGATPGDGATAQAHQGPGLSSYPAAVAIGGNHFIHAARRNIDITALIVNNSIYGMTGGQYSPTTPYGMRSATTVYNNIEQSFKISELAVTAGAGLVGRGTVYHAKLLDSLMETAFLKKGFSVVEVISQCPTIYGRMNKMGSPVDMLKWQRENAIPLEKVLDRWSGETSLFKEDLGGKFLTGVFVDREAPEFVTRRTPCSATPRSTRPPARPRAGPAAPPSSP